MNNLETSETRARYKEQESRIMMRSELSDEQKDDAIDALFSRYCADYNCYESNARTSRLSSSSSGGDSINGNLGIGTIAILIFLGVVVGKYFNELIEWINTISELLVK